MAHLRPLTPNDVNQALAVYADAVLTQAATLYEPRQIKAWAGHAENSPELRAVLMRGRGMVSCAAQDPSVVEAFAVLDPIDRLSLLYCRGRSCRQGRAKALLEALESIARDAGCRQLRTEASQLSKPLLLRHGWQVETEETVPYAGELFTRWRMIKVLVPVGDG